MKKLLLLLFILFLSSCEALPMPDEQPDDPLTPNELGIDTHDTIYQLQVYAFHDSDGDGLGDFKGIALKVDYLVYLGIDAIWLSPIHPSPSYHHYDVTDYFGVDDAYVVDDFSFEDLLDVLHAHGIDVILDIVVNHSSVEHPFFIEAVNAYKNNLESPYIDYYIFSDTPFTHPTLGYTSAYLDGIYYDAFYGITTMPALNYDNIEVREMFIDIFSYWLDKGVAGFRLDASKHIYDDLEKNIEVLTYFVDELEKTYDDVYFINEIWASQQEVIPYFETGMSNFNFDARNYIAAAIAGERTYGAYLEDYQQAVRALDLFGREASFLSNHDIGRLGTGYSLEDQKMMAALNILAPGNSYVYYGDEIDLKGSRTLNDGYNGYIDAVYRTPMLWDDWTYSFADYIVDGSFGAIKSAQTTSRLTVEDALDDPNSLLNYYAQLIALKNEFPAISTGTLNDISLHDELISYQIENDENMILLIHNLNDSSNRLINNNFFNIEGFVSQTGDATLIDNVLNIPALSSVIITLSEPIDAVDPNDNTNTQAYIMSDLNGWTENIDYLMTEDDGLYSYTITFHETSQFKVKVGDSWYGYSEVSTFEDLNVTQELNYDNIIIGPGTYIITFSNASILIESAS